MQLKNGLHLGYCTNIHRGETWAETFHGLDQYTLKVKERVCSDSRPYGIGLRLSAGAANELTADSGLVDDFRRWLDVNNAYVFTINGFPYGTFHGNRVKEQVYAPDWSTPERLSYTNLLFDLLCEIAPEGESGSVSTLPGSFKEFIIGQPDESDKISAIIANLRSCNAHLEKLREQTGRDLHLGLEPEPLGLFENSSESVSFFGQLTDGLSTMERESILRNIGINYDTCHLAIEYENAADAFANLRGAGLRISKIHLSSALKLKPDVESITRLAAFHEEVYLHQVIVQDGGEVIERFRDLPDALAWATERGNTHLGDEWRVHFHVPIHAQPEAIFGDTRDHISDTLDLLGKDPGWCSHFEMETYTWEVMPEAMRSGDVVDQLTREYEYCLAEFERTGLA